MWRNRRQLAFLTGLIVSTATNSIAANAQPKRMIVQRPVQVVSVTQDAAGNFVLLNTATAQQLPVPQMKYLPADNGGATLAVDFVGVVLNATPALFRPATAAIKQISIGQLQQMPPVMRIAFSADDRTAFKSLDFRSTAGRLIIKLPNQSGQWARRSKAYESVGSPPVAPEHKLSTAAVAPQPAEDPNAPKLRGPILATVDDATYTVLPATPVPAAKERAAAKETVPAAKERAAAKETVQAAKERAAAKEAVPAAKERAAAKETVPAAKERAAAKEAVPAAKERAAAKETVPAAKERAAAKETVPAAKERAAAKETVPAAKERTAKENVPAAEEQPAAKQSADSTAVQMCWDAQSSVLKISLDKPANFKTFRLHDPERYVIDIENVLPGAIEPAPVPEQLASTIKAVRVGSPEGSGNTRIVVDLASTDVPVKDQATPDGQSLSMSFVTSPAEPAPAIAPPRTRGKLPQNCVVLLDAGHGGSDPGAQRGDIQEKELTLAIVQKLKKELEARGVRTRMTRADDTFVSLEDRVRITNELQPDAFISVHINAMQTNEQTTGVETYYQNDASKDLAELIHASLVKQLHAPDRSVRKARFYVINHTPVPAILAEVGFISNKEERDKLTSSDYQLEVAAALADGVMLYLCNQTSRVQPVPDAARHSNSDGTISAMSASSGTQSFTQNLQRKNADWRPRIEAKAARTQAFEAQDSREKRIRKVARQSLKFKKSHLAMRRS